MIAVEWSDIKAQIALRGNKHNHVELQDCYLVMFCDGPFVLQCRINKDGGADVTEYEATHKANANKTIYQTDLDGSPLSRVKTTKLGWHIQPHAVEFTTAKYGGYFNKTISLSDFDTESDLGFVTHKIYGADGTEITSSLAEALAVRTVIDWMPTHDYEIIGAKYYQVAAPATDVRIWVIGLPDSPVASPILFGQGGANLKHLGIGAALQTDGRSSKLLTYNATYKTNKFRIVLKHGTGVQHSGQIMWEIYKAP